MCRKSGILFISFLILGCITGYIVAKVDQTGRFEKWRYLGSPPGGGIEIVDSYGSTVFVKSENGGVYSCHIQFSEHSPPCWEETEWPLKVRAPTQVITAENSNKWIANTPKGGIDSIIVSYNPGVEVGSVAQYILFEDGTVQAWHHSIHSMMYIWANIYFIFVGAILGAILGMITLGIIHFTSTKIAN